ncbi:hypothetical protein [Streptomyces sp. NPDC127098]|uniref:hypothetical protein n=1 Tax=Streptomyces sp. NPDC127098 TaxID=3347137 RepID=UPI0036566FB9
MPRSSDYWIDIARAGDAYVHSCVHLDDMPAAMTTVKALRARYGSAGLLDLSAVLLLVTANKCPVDRFRTPDGHPDAIALTSHGPVDALRILDATAAVTRYMGRQLTVADIANTERQAEEVERVQQLVQVALDAAPDLEVMAAALRPAQDSLGAVSAVVALATIALRVVTQSAG